MDKSPIFSLLYFILGASVLAMWIGDLRRPQDGRMRFWPGATKAHWQSILFAISGAILLTIIETLLENHLGLREQQQTLPAHYLFAMLGASIVEEITFRGFGAPETLGGFKLLVVTILGSAIFVALHGYGLSDVKGWVSSGSAFAVSCWLYLSRFSSLNPSRSMIPSLAGHTARNLAVFGVKASQGYIVWG